MTIDHEKFMRLAMREADKAARWNEVPVGAVIVLDGKVVGRGFNLTRKLKDPTAHAEVIALRKAGKRIGNERLTGALLYSTLEPCPMCAGAIVHSRVSILVFAADDPKAGACGSVMSVIPHEKLNHRPYVIRGVLGAESGAMLSSFFRTRRAEKKQKKRSLK